MPNNHCPMPTAHCPMPTAQHPLAPKQEVLWSVDRQTPGKQTAEFFEASGDLYLEMCHQENLLELSLWRLLLRWKPFSNKAMLGIAIVQNVLILLRFSGEDGALRADAGVLTTEHPPEGQGRGGAEVASGFSWDELKHNSTEYHSTLGATQRLLGCVQVRRKVRIRGRLTTASTAAQPEPLFAPRAAALPESLLDLSHCTPLESLLAFHRCSRFTAARPYHYKVLASVVIFALYALQNGPLQQRRMWREFEEQRTYEELLARARDVSPHGLTSAAELCYKLRFWLTSFGFVFMDGKGLFFAACMLAAVLGIVHSPFWFAFHLLDVITKSKDLQNVFKAVTQNGRSIMMTAVFGVIIVYIYAIVGYVYLSDSFAIENIAMCTNLADCWVGALSEGLRGGDIGGFMEPRQPTDAMFYVQVAYQLSFWAIVITILLNVIFGIIIDTFGELRSDNLAKKHDMENACFVCGVDRFTLDTKGGGFVRHIKEDHYMWNYLYLIVHLREKSHTEYNGWEQHVADCIARSDTSFLPVNMAISLSEHKEREESESREYANRLLDIQAQATAAAKVSEP